MELSDKVRRVAFTLTVGSIGAGIGYIANDVVEVIGERRQEFAAKEEANRQYLERQKQYVPPVPKYHHPEPSPGEIARSVIGAM